MDDNGKMPDISPTDFKETPQYQEMDSGPTPAPQREAPEPVEHAQPEAEQNNTMLNSLAEKGYDVSAYGSDQEFIEDTETKYAAALQEQQRTMAEKYQQGQEWAEQAQAQPPVPPVPQSPAAVGNQAGMPDFDPSWADLVEDDGSGRYVIRPEYIGSVDPSIADRVNQYISFRTQRGNALIEDPVNTVLQAGLGSMIQQQIQNTVTQALTQTSVKNQAKEFVRANEKVLYLHDEQGNAKRTNKGEPILSPVGQALNQAHVQLRQQGMLDPNARHQVAMQMVQNYFTQQQLSGVSQQVPQQVPQQAPQQQMHPNDMHKEQYTEQPFSEPTNPYPPGYMPNTPVQPTANAMGSGGLPEHNSLGSLATALAVHKGYLQPK